MLNHLSALWSRHSILEAKIQHEEKRPLPDSLRIQALKKLRLKVRERIAAVEARLSGSATA
ncbi:hypothetical protein CSC94_08280 [Zhengella mangrovi]|uniref:DUF465 domain-containing protein n=1 Tax=Zhengella mangrovi TaxID=1982044 RepID=A0A2G1QQ94_9HYPH|nr:DUF465 domain-containing protein [Zhengella mangrovi]PHP67683.1 hypothetical protein CSC94_08280 [Zhengella mangrovi]